MRSEHVDRFNHDEDAPDYDADVLDESGPVREGYSRLLDWVATEAGCGPGCSVVELGTGTGNLAVRLGGFARLTCVDVSREMLRIARGKLAGRGDVEFVLADILEYMASPRRPCHLVVSTYAIHHLTEDERAVLFRRVADALEPDGRAIFGDLMFENAAHRSVFLSALRARGEHELVDEIEDEFFWDLERAERSLRECGFEIGVRRFGELAFGVVARMG